MINADLMKPWHGIPGKEIDWYPKVDEERCTGCGLCVTSCGRMVYQFDYETRKPVVKNPYHCMVACNTCANLCIKDAIQFPGKEIVTGLIKSYRLLSVAKKELEAQKPSSEIQQ